MRSLTAVLLLVAAPLGAQAAGTGAVADADPAREARVDSVFRAYARTDGPGCAVGVARDGRTALAKGYGMADLEHGVPIGPRSVFYVGSVSKQFTAMSVLLLAERGALSLDDDVRRWVPELPDYGAPITVRHLLHHTSGLRDYLTMQSLVGHPVDAPMSEPEFLELVARQRGLNFQPGAEHRYSNTGYVLLSIVAGRASGGSLRRVAEEGIFRPLGMTDTRFRDDRRELVPRRAHGYVPARGGWQLSTPMSDLVGGGGVFSTVLDLLKWGANFDAGPVGSPETRRRQVTVGTLADGRPLVYAAGLTLGAFEGADVVEHGGSLAGYRAHFLRVPSARLAVAVTCNASNANPSALARGVARAYLGSPRAAAAGARDTTPVAAVRTSISQQEATFADPADLARHAGTYQSEELGVTWTIVARGDTLLLRRPRFADAPLRVTGDGHLGFGSTTLRFTRSGGAVTGFTVHAGRAEGMAFARE